MTMPAASGAAHDAAVHTEPPNPHDVERASDDVANAQDGLQRLRDKAVKSQEHLTATINAIPSAEREVEDAHSRLAALTEMEG